MQHDYAVFKSDNLQKLIKLSMNPNIQTKILVITIVSDKNAIKELLGTYNIKLIYGKHVLIRLMKIRDCLKGFFLVPIPSDIINIIKRWTNGIINDMIILSAINPSWMTYDVEQLRNTVIEQNNNLKALHKLGIYSIEDAKKFEKNDPKILSSLYELATVIIDLIYTTQSYIK